MTASVMRPVEVAPAQTPGTGPTVRRRIAGAFVEIVLAIGCLAVAAKAVNVMRHRLPTTLNVATDIIGYPTFHAFDGEQYLETFYLVVLAGPFLALVLFVILAASAARVGLPLARRGPLLPRARFDPPVATSEKGMTGATPHWLGTGRSAVIAAGRIGCVGAVLGVELAIHRGRVGGHFWVNVAEGVVVYSLCAAAAGAALMLIWRRRRRVIALMPALSAVNAIGACLSVAGLALVSSVTQIITLDDHVTHMLPWMDARVAVLGAALLGGAVIRAALSRPLDAARANALERRAVLLVAIPVLVFLWIAQIPGTLPPFLTFEQGQQVATLRMIQAGDLPWRDFIGAHGLLEDTFRLVPGALLFGQTQWGMVAGFYLLVVPLQFIALYFFAYRVFGAMTAALLAVVGYFFHSNALFPYTRFMFWPLLLILMLVTLDRRSRVLAGAMGLALVVYNLIAPETAYCVAAIGVALVCHDVYRAHWQRGWRLRSFELTIGYVLGVVVGTAVALAALAAFGGLHGLLIYYSSNVSGHNLEGLIPLQPLDPPFRTWVYAPAIGVLLAMVVVAAKMRLRRVLGSRDFAMMAAAVVTILYYEKFTDRADLHVVQVYMVAVPLFLLVARELLDVAEVTLSWATKRVPWSRLLTFPAGIAVLVLAVVTAPVGMTTIAAHSAERYRAVAAEEPWWPSLGYAARADEVLDRDLRTVLELYTTPGERVFDFANEPGLLYWVENLRPSTRYYMVNIAMPQVAQRELVSELASARPRYIVYFGTAYDALPIWDDVGNAVRHYDVSQYILDHYHPVLSVDTQVLYAVNGASNVPDPALLRGRVEGTVFTNDLEFRGYPCGWGYSPEFLNISHPLESQAVSIPTAIAAGRTTLSPPPGHAWADYHWIEVQASSGTYAADTFTLAMGTATGEDRTITFQTIQGSSKIYRFPIAACPQWHGYGSSPIQLTHQVHQDVTVRLLP